MLKIYTTSTCGFCEMLKSFLKDKKIKYREYDVGLDEKARREMLEKSGQYGVPVIEVNGKILTNANINLAELEKTLKSGRTRPKAAALRSRVEQNSEKKRRMLQSNKRSFSKTKND